MVQGQAEVKQKLLEKVISNIFPGQSVVSNVRSPHFKNPNTGHALEIDVLIPKLNICFEFQDLHHYSTTEYYHSPLQKVQQHDYILFIFIKSIGDRTIYYMTPINIKSEIVREKENVLIQIPCWWDGKQERPDLSYLIKKDDLPSPVTLNPSISFINRNVIPDIGEMMLASFPSTSSHLSKNSWWMGEKYDGILVCWHPRYLKLYIRTGSELELPNAVINKMPSSFLHGEIWFGRGGHDEAMKLFHNSYDLFFWINCRMMMFDSPMPGLLEEKFEDRYTQLLNSIPFDHSFIIPSARVMWEGKKQLSHFLKWIVKDGGEGVILREKKSPYVHGRSSSLIKLKTVRADKEALVVDIDEDVISVITPDGEGIEVNWQNVDYACESPNRGDVVTLSYFQNHSSPLAYIFRIRQDVTWQDVLRDALSPSLTLKEPLESAFDGDPKTVMGVNETIVIKKRKIRKNFEDFAKAQNLDPLQADTWYSIYGSTFKQFKKFKSSLAMYKGSHIRALIDVFPEINLEKQKFIKVPQDYWKDINNRRQFIKQLAYDNGLDPQDPNVWYKRKTQQIVQKHAQTLMGTYYNGYVSALLHLFPDIGLEVDRFNTYPVNYWTNVRNQRKWFISFAGAHHFDPYLPVNWYSVPRVNIINHPKGNSMLTASYNGNHIAALIASFPELHFDPTKFINFPKNYFEDENAQREVFQKFAKSKNFDVLIPDHWYPVTLDDFLSFKQGASAVLRQHSGSLTKALIKLFPLSKWDLTKFTKTPSGYYEDVKNRRAFMEKVSKINNFDSLVAENWYDVTYDQVTSLKGGATVLSYYNHSVPRALLDLFPDIGLINNKFNTSRDYWKNEENRRKFCEKFAREKGFNPYIHKNWTLISRKKFVEQGGGRALQYYTGQSFVEIMASLFSTNKNNNIHNK